MLQLDAEGKGSTCTVFRISTALCVMSEYSDGVTRGQRGSKLIYMYHRSHWPRRAKLFTNLLVVMMIEFTFSHKPLLPREVCVLSGGAGCSAAAVAGADSPTTTLHENCECEQVLFISRYMYM